MAILEKIINFTKSYYNKNETKNIKKGTRKIRVSWVSPSDITATEINIRGFDYSFKRVIDPLTNTDKENPKRNQECVFISDGFEFKEEGNKCPCASKKCEGMIPILHLEPGEKFVQFI